MRDALVERLGMKRVGRHALVIEVGMFYCLVKEVKQMAQGRCRVVED